MPQTPDYSRKWWVMGTIATGVLLATIDGSIVNVALPTLVEEFDTTFAVIQWVSLGYLLTLATLTLGVGRLGDIVGKKKIYTSGFSAFTLASILCGFSPSVGWLIGFRVVQALGATMVLSLGIAILTEAFPSSERGKAIGLVGTAVSIGIITGPVVGGILISAFDWRYIFFVNIPVGIAGTLLAIRHIPNTPPVGGQRMDFLGAIILSISLLALSLALTLGQDAGLGAPHILVLFVVAALSGSGFVIRMLRVDDPMVDLRLFRSPLLTVSVVSGFLTFVAVSALFLLLPFFLEGVLGFDIALVGILLGASPIALGVVAPISGWLSDRIGVRVLTLIGLVMMSASYFGFRTVSVDMSIPHYLALAIPFGIGIGIFQSPNNSAIMGAVPRAFTGLAAGLLSITRLLGQITGVAVVGSIWASRVAARSAAALPGGDATAALPGDQVAGLQDVFTILGVILLAAALVGTWGLARERQDKNPSDQPNSVPRPRA